MLPTLLEKSLERGWRVVVQAASEERVEALDAHLWTYRDDSFLPHGTGARGGCGASSRSCSPSPTTIPTAPHVRFLIDGAPVPADAAGYERIVLIFDGEDPDAVARGARALERGQGERLRRRPIGRPDEDGRWQRMK